MQKVAYTKKIALMGDATVGKTSLQERYLGLGFKESYVATLGANFSTKDFESDQGLVRVIIVDMGGQPAFKPIREKFFRGTSGVMLVFDVTKPYDAEQQILPWVEEILEYTQQEGLPLVVLANKIDLEFIRQIPMFSGQNATVEVKAMIESSNPIEYLTSHLSGSLHRSWLT
ncbi:MAG: Rab family GTPase [Candidatus Kariarchaeaceae archaeon]|jgi:small GTP-binding protein